MLANIVLFFTTAKAIVSTVVDLILNDVLGSISKWIREEFSAFSNLEQNLEKLSSALDTINDVRQDAENKKPESQGLRNWLRKIKNAAAEGQDLLDMYAAKKGNIVCRIRVAHGTKKLLKRLDEIAVEKDQFNLTASLYHKEGSRESKNVAADLKHINEVFLEHNRLKESVDRNYSQFSFTVNSWSLVISWGDTNKETTSIRDKIREKWFKLKEKCAAKC